MSWNNKVWNSFLQTISSDIDNDKAAGNKWEYNEAYLESWLLRFFGPPAALPTASVMTPCKSSAAAIFTCRSPNNVRGKNQSIYQWTNEWRYKSILK